MTIEKVWRAEALKGSHSHEQVAIKKIDLEKYGDQRIEEIRVRLRNNLSL